MKKLSVFILILLFCIVYFLFCKKENVYKVLKVNSALEIYIDFNNNLVADENELVVFDLPQSTEVQLNKIQSAELAYLAKEFAVKSILNKNVKVFFEKNNKPVVILPDGKDYIKLLIEKGLFPTDSNCDKVIKNIEYADKLDLVAYNKHTNRYHKLDCKFAFGSSNIEILKFSDIKQNAKPCNFCHSGKRFLKKHIDAKYPLISYEKYEPAYKDFATEFYVTDFTKYYYPSDKCFTTVCTALLKEIKNAKSTIDFAIYGIDRQPEIKKELLLARKRGVKVRWVYDADKKGKATYPETLLLKNTLNLSRADTQLNFSVDPNYAKKDAIMHNKFFIFDNEKVWTGSANITHTDLSGFNANSVILINSSEIAKIYKNEFEQMYNGYFHVSKSKNLSNKIRVGLSTISVYFSPQDNIIDDHIVPLINNAKKYVYVPVFVITHKSVNTALVNAQKRGVDVRVITDATSAGAKYSSVSFLRSNNVKVKTEDRPGKMHMKSLIVDDKYIVIGSMNFTKSGEQYNDENVLIIENPQMAKAFKNKFLHFWKTIPDKWLYRNPAAESYSSVNSCFDGIDNDFDGKIDKDDSGCQKTTHAKKLLYK